VRPRLALGPFGAIVFAFFMPTVHSCQHDSVPMRFVVADGGRGVWALPVFVAALVFGAATLIALSQRRAPGRIVDGAALLALMSPVILGVQLVIYGRPVDAPWAIAAVVGFIVGVIVLALGAQRAGWARWRFAVAGYLVSAASVSSVLVEALWHDDLAIGGFVYLASLGLLVPIVLWPERAKTAGA
jgi:hypothetical protein